MAQRLLIDGKEADLGNNVIAITRKVIDLSDLSLRNIDITNRLLLPKTNKNQEIFYSADRVGTNGDGMDREYSAKIIDSTIIFNGVGYLNESNGTYQFQLVESSNNVFSNLNDKINMLPYDSHDFTFNKTSYDNLKLLSNSNLWVWPIVAMHEDKTESNTNFAAGNDGLKYSRPSFSFWKILNDAIEAQGWALEMDTDICERVGFSSNASKFYVTSYQKTLDETVTLGSVQNIDDLDTNDFENDVTTTSTTISTGTTPTIFRLRGNISSDNGAIIKVVSTSSGTGEQQTKEFNISSRETYIDLKTSSFKPSGSDTDISIEITIEGSGSFTFDDTLLYTIIEEQELGVLSGNQLIGYRVKAFDNMSNKTQLDLLMDAMKITNSIIEPDSKRKIIKLRSLKNLSKLNSVDWSEKFDADNYTVTNKINGYAKKNYLIYDNDDSVNSELGEDNFDINNQSLEDVEDVLQLQWGASEEVAIENYESFPIASYNIYNDDERLIDINDRLIYIYDNTDVTPLYTLGRFLPLDWKTLKAEYYQNWFDSFFRFRFIEGFADLNQLDVIGHDFLKLVYIDHFKSTFFVQSFEDFTSGKVTEVELFKIL